MGSKQLLCKHSLQSRNRLFPALLSLRQVSWMVAMSSESSCDGYWDRIFSLLYPFSKKKIIKGGWPKAQVVCQLYKDIGKKQGTATVSEGENTGKSSMAAPVWATRLRLYLSLFYSVWGPGAVLRDRSKGKAVRCLFQSSWLALQISVFTTPVFKTRCGCILFCKYQLRPGGSAIKATAAVWYKPGRYKHACIQSPSSSFCPPPWPPILFFRSLDVICACAWNRCLLWTP